MKASQTMRRYLEFFAVIEQRWADVPSYDVLLVNFGAAALRRVALPMTWLAETRRITVDASAREADSEKRRIDALLSAMPVTSVGGVALAAYHRKLQLKVVAGATTVRSNRLALTPALALLSTVDAEGRSLPTQAALVKYLSQSPGQVAAVTGFVRFLNAEHGTSLNVRIDESVLRAHRRRVREKVLLALAKRAVDSPEFELEWIRAGLAYFHDHVKPGGSVVRSPDGSGFSVSVGDNYLWIPSWARFTPTGKG
ncbi:hypothetical protein PCA31118_01648 [Pandoraea captiosa]|uniref:Uncharacterized protein n=1 Tax=Pandoraea captiosa TaxID=2508302 RepID=A0A5E4ZU17_9BURK|nr:hypothetical protein [Pandoraea captiosa]VVE64566.1 hypothetical protein PCA31118_01648 [Pandoraea captiosa]